ncbi:MAG: ABC transporter permease [Gemmatimonadaceae bacterium]
MRWRERLAASSFWPMVWKEFIQMRRDPFTIGMMLGIPALQLILFGYAIRTEVRHIPTVVLDESRTAESRALVDVIRNTGNFDVVGNAGSREEIRLRVERGEVRAAIVIPPDYQRDIKRGRTAQVQLLVDAADPLSSNAAISGASLAGATRATQLLGTTGRRAPPVEVRVRPWYNPGLKSSTFIVPGIIGTLLSIMLILITSMAVVRERERGTLEQLVVTPIGRTSLLLGKIVPFAIVGFVQMTVILVLGKLFFAIPMRGSLALLYLAGGTFIVANLALGVFLSTLAKTQVQAMQLSFFFLLPNILLSGFMFPREAMPAPAMAIGWVLPLTYFLQVIRGILLKGVGLGAVWPEMLALTAFTVVLVALSVARFQKQIG